MVIFDGEQPFESFYLKHFNSLQDLQNCTECFKNLSIYSSSIYYQTSQFDTGSFKRILTQDDTWLDDTFWKNGGNYMKTPFSLGTLNSNPLSFIVSGSEKLLVTSDGIGINMSPSYSLDINGSLRVYRSSLYVTSIGSVGGIIDYTRFLSVNGSTGINGQFLKRTFSSNDWSNILTSDVTGLNAYTSSVNTSLDSKQAQLSGSGFVKATGTTISYDNSTYLTTSSAASTYLPINNPTATGTLTAPIISNSLGATFATTSGNVGIGTASTIRKFDVKASSGTSQIASFYNSDFVFPTIGTSLSFSTGATTGNTFFKIQANNSGESAAGMLALNPNGGNVGVGTTTDAGYKLDVNGTARVVGDLSISSGNKLSLSANNLTYNTIERDVTNGGILLTANTYKTFFKDNGNVGIGTTAPNAPLQFANNTQNRKIVLYENANNDHDFYGFGVNSGILRYQTGIGTNHVFYAGATTTTSNELMRIQSNGNVGIGLSAPTKKLHVYDNSGGVGNTTIRLESLAGGYGAGIEAGSIIAGTSTYLSMGKAVWDGEAAWNSTTTTQDSYFTIHTAQDGTVSEKMRITSGGNVGIGITPTVPLHVQKGAAGSVVASFLNTNQFGLKIIAQTGGSGSNTSITNAGGESISIDPNNAESTRFFANGRVGIGTGGVDAGYKLDVNGTVRAGTVTSQSGALISARNTGNSFEFGHSNQAGYGSTLGANSGNGFSFLAFNAEAGTTNNTFRTRGLNGRVITNDINNNRLQFQRTTSSSADNQTPVVDMTIDGSGNMGIGTVVPSEKLEIYDSGTTSLKIVSTTNANFRGLKIGNENATYSSLLQRLDTGELKLEAGLTTWGGFQTFYTNGVERMRILSNGLVGINTTSPIGMLDIKLDTNQHIQFVANVNGAYSGASGIVAINDANSAYTPMGFYASNYFFGNGNVGIGTTAPAAKLHIRNGIDRNLWFRVNGAGDGTEILSINDSQASRQQLAFSASSFYFDLGNVGIGTVSPLTKFHVKRTGLNGAGLALAGILATDGKTIGDGIGLDFFGHDSGNNEQGYGSFRYTITNPTVGAEASELSITTWNAGANTERIKVSSTGNVGIGTTAPSEKLEVSGVGVVSSRITSTNSTAQLITSGTVGQIYNTTGDLYLTNGSTTNSTLFVNNGAERMRIFANGRVGINTTTDAGYLLDVNGTSIVRGTARFQSPSQAGYTELLSNATGALHLTNGHSYFSTNASAYDIYFQKNGNSGTNMIIKDNGNVGVGILTPSNLLHIKGTATQGIGVRNSHLIIESAETAGVDVGAVLKFGGQSGNTVNPYSFATIEARKESAVANNYSSYLSFFTIESNGGSTERMRINGSGNVGIGTTSPSAKLDIVGNVNTTGAIYFNSRLFAYTSGTYSILHDMNASSGTAHANIYMGNGDESNYYDNTAHRFRNRAGTSNRLEIFGNGNIGIGTGGVDSSFKLDVNGTTRLNGNVSIGTTSNDRTLTVATSTNIINTEFLNSKTSGDSYGLIANSNGIGATLNMGGVFTASGGTSNYGLRIFGVPSTANNYSIYSDSLAKSYFQGSVIIGTPNDQGYKLDVVGTAQATQFKLSALNTAPANATAAGTVGEIRVDANYIYICTLTNTWKRSAITTW